MTIELKSTHSSSPALVYPWISNRNHWQADMCSKRSTSFRTTPASSDRRDSHETSTTWRLINTVKLMRVMMSRRRLKVLAKFHRNLKTIQRTMMMMMYDWRSIKNSSTFFTTTTSTVDNVLWEQYAKHLDCILLTKVDFWEKFFTCCSCKMIQTMISTFS